MTDPIKIECVPGPGQFGGYSFIITDDAIRAIVERANAMGLLGGKLQLPAPRDPMPEIKFDAPPFDKPAAPADDEATIAGLLAGMNRYAGSMRGFAIGAMEVIRRGEAPGLTTLDKCSDLINEHARAMNERDALKAEVERIVKTMGAEVERNMKLQAEVERLRALYEAAINDCPCPYKADRDAAIARAEKAEDEGIPVEQVDEIIEQRDTARAAHAEAMELLVFAMENEVDIDDKYSELVRIHLAKYGKDASK